MRAPRAEAGVSEYYIAGLDVVLRRSHHPPAAMAEPVAEAGQAPGALVRVGPAQVVCAGREVLAAVLAKVHQIRAFV